MFNVDKMTKTNYFSLNSFLLYVPYVYPLKTTENQKFPSLVEFISLYIYNILCIIHVDRKM